MAHCEEHAQVVAVGVERAAWVTGQERCHRLRFVERIGWLRSRQPAGVEFEDGYGGAFVVAGPPSPQPDRRHALLASATTRPRRLGTVTPYVGPL